ncbi:MAG: TetR/AcrR family transcriptional regulator [Bacillota bacterium]|nr:TetR/AcrR family transcriptional regulator [Bacillota bacterium]
MLESKKELILKVSEEEFKKNGYKKTSIVSIAKKAGISTVTLYSYYQNKKTLFEAVSLPNLKEYSPDDEQNMRKIIMTALKLFSEKGYSAVTISDVANTCGFSKVVINKFFKTKSELFAAIFNTDIFYQQQLDSHDKTLKLSDFLRRSGLGFLKLFDNPYRVNIIRIAIDAKTPLNDAGKIMYQSTIHKVTEGLAEQLKVLGDSGKIKTTDYYIAARSFLGILYSFIITDRLLDPTAEQIDADKILDFAVNIFEKGLK